MKAALSPLLMLLLAGAALPAQTAWEAWEHGLARTCPGRHVELMGDGGYLDFIAAFEATLPTSDRERLDKAADLERRCADEKMGFGCEMAGTIAAARDLGLLGRMIAFGCRTVKCEEGAICSRMPRAPD